MRLKSLIGLRVLAIKGFTMHPKTEKYVEAVFILFDDRKTFIQLSEQDYYSYHNCSSAAREIEVRTDPIQWGWIYGNAEGRYPNANTDI